MPAARAQQTEIASDKFYKYLESLKQDIIRKGKYEKDETGKLPFESMDKTDILDDHKEQELIYRNYGHVTPFTNES